MKGAWRFCRNVTYLQKQSQKLSKTQGSARPNWKSGNFDLCKAFCKKPSPPWPCLAKKWRGWVWWRNVNKMNRKMCRFTSQPSLQPQKGIFLPFTLAQKCFLFRHFVFYFMIIFHFFGYKKIGSELWNFPVKNALIFLNWLQFYWENWIKTKQDQKFRILSWW